MKFEQMRRQVDSFYRAVTAVIHSCAEIRDILKGLPARRGWGFTQEVREHPEWDLSEEKCRRLNQLFQLSSKKLGRAKRAFTTKVQDIVASVHSAGFVEWHSFREPSYGEIGMEIARSELDEIVSETAVMKVTSQSALLERICVHLGDNHLLDGQHTDQVDPLVGPFQDLIRLLKEEADSAARSVGAKEKTGNEGGVSGTTGKGGGGNSEKQRKDDGSEGTNLDGIKTSSLPIGGDTGEPKKRMKTAMSWQDAAERMKRLRSQGEPWTSQREMAKRFSCSLATINKAIQNTPELQTWSRPQRTPKAESLTPHSKQNDGWSDKVADQIHQEREPNPADEAAIREFVEQADPQTRGWFNALSRDEQLAYLNDPDKHQNILGRKP